MGGDEEEERRVERKEREERELKPAADDESRLLTRCG